MCDPVSIVVGAVAGSALAGGKQRAAALPDPAAERAAAESDATTSANRKLAAARARRREQGSLIARGAPQPTLGDVVPADAGMLSASPVSKSSTAARTSLLSRGSPTSATSAMGTGTRAVAHSRLTRQQAY